MVQDGSVDIGPLQDDCVVIQGFPRIHDGETVRGRKGPKSHL